MLIKFLPRDDAFQVCSRANSASGHARSDAASYSGETSRPATGARPPVGSHMQGGGAPYKSFSSAALDPHRTIHNPLLPFGNVAQTVIDGLAVFACLVLVCATGVGLAAAIFFLFFCKF